MKVLVFPRSTNPYQELLYGEMEKLGAEVSYVGEITSSHLLNLLLLPAELTIRRLGGAQVIHLHWVWDFWFPGARRLPLMRRAAQAWFYVCLRVIRLLRLRLAWTAHNVLPHSPVFADDVAARRFLVRECDVVLAHSEWTFTCLLEMGMVPRRSVVVKHGPFDARPRVDSVSTRDTGGRGSKFMFFGRIMQYKGVEDLLQAFASLPEHIDAHLRVVGKCEDPNLRLRIEKLTQEAGDRVALWMQHVSDSEIGPLMASADVVVLPFRHVTTSGSALLALAHGKPIVIPKLAALDDLPDDAVFRYDGSLPGLTATLLSIVGADREVLDRMSAAARMYNAGTTWRQVAEMTMAEFHAVLHPSGPP